VTREGQFEREAPKNFRIPGFHAALTIAGAFSVEGVQMDLWMPGFLERANIQAVESLETIADRLRLALDCEMGAHEKACPTLVHIAGYERRGRTYRPVLYFVRNTLGISENGSYFPGTDTFVVSEDFFARDCQRTDCSSGFGADEYVCQV